MASIHKINNQHKSFINPKSTGYATAASLILTTATAFSKQKVIRKSHKPLAFTTAGLTILHIVLTEYYHQKYKKM